MTEPFDAKPLEDCIVLSADSAALFRLLERRARLAQRWLVSLAARMPPPRPDWSICWPAGPTPR